MKPLNRKTLRDLSQMKAQALAIGAVVAVGVLLLVMMGGLVNSLEETRRAYYERYRIADIFAPVKRAPRHIVARIAELPGVDAVEGRIAGTALIDIAGSALPVHARAVSLPEHQGLHLNDVYLTAGRMPDPRHASEILLLNRFAQAHDLRPGNTLRATMNGVRRQFLVTGLAQSPEFLYVTAPGELISEEGRYAVLWMGERELSAAFELEGSYNEILINAGRFASTTAIISGVNRILRNYGGAGAYPLAELPSDRFVTEEIAGLRTTSTIVPPIFLGVAAFLLYIVISRMVQSQREQIGLLKAFGYRNSEIGAHYLKFVLVIAIGGAFAGSLLGIAAGRAMVNLYMKFYNFPFLLFQLDPRTFVAGAVISVAAASAGSLFVLGRIFRLQPAVAMRPPIPPDYSSAAQIGRRFIAMFDQPTRMVLRRLARQKARTAGSVIGVASAMALAVAMNSIVSSYDDMISLSFDVIERGDVSVSFANALSDQAVFALRRMPGIIDAEPARSVSATLRKGRRSYRGGVTGILSEPHLYRAVGSNASPIHIPRHGIVLSQGLADILGAVAGDEIEIDVHEGGQPALSVQVAAIAESLLGSPAFMHIDELNRKLREPGRVSGAYLRIDSEQSQAVYARLKSMPAIAGVSVKEQSREALQKVMDQGAGATRYIMLAIAWIITFGVVYNAARIALAERSRDLASLRVLGFTRNETAFVLLGEIFAIVLAALPLGSIAGHWLNHAIAEGFSTDLYRIQVAFSPASHGIAALAVLAALAISGWLVKRDSERIDLVSALKTWE